MLEDAAIRQRVKAAIVAALKLQIDPEAIADNEVLFGGGLGADSTATMEVVFAVEETFDIEVSDEDLRPDLFDSVSSLCNYVKRKLNDNNKKPPASIQQDRWFFLSHQPNGEIPLTLPPHFHPRSRSQNLK